jgi:site-specific DNA-methyltransferase (cytosine-N4-specific)
MQQISNYDKYRKKDDIHGTVLYPAPMIAPMQRDIIKDLTKDIDNAIILDPFHGSSVSLYEAATISGDFSIIGYDINPFANLISRVKLQGVSNNILENIKIIEKDLDKNLNFKMHDFPKIDKWFRKDIKCSLSKIRNSIMRIEEKKDRMFFWVMFADLVRKYSNTRSSTYKLHTKTEEKISGMKNDVVYRFIKKIKSDYKFYNQSFNNISIKKCDSLVELQSLEDKSINILVTSPPYGDNHTTVPYGQFSTLALFWIDSEDLDLNGWELDNYSAIDSNSMGGKSKSIEFKGVEKSIFDKYTLGIDNMKLKKVRNFFIDYFSFLKSIARITEDYIVLTLGNRTVDRVNISLTDVSIDYLDYLGFEIQSSYERDVFNKRTPKMTSAINGRPVQSMTKEYVLILKPKNDISN